MQLIEPSGLLSGASARAAIRAGHALPLAGGPLAFSLVRLVGSPGPVPVRQIPPAWQDALDQLTRQRPAWAGLTLDRPAVMGVLNLTADSFSDGGRYPDAEAAIAAGLAMADAGADIIDVGGESTRPGATPVPAVVEQARVLPVVAALAQRRHRVSIDTRNASTMAAALESGAEIVNDVSALCHDAAAAPLIAARGCPVILMHMRGTPETMNREAVYDDVATTVTRELHERVRTALGAGIAADRIALDPGIGFAKTGLHNLELLAKLPLLLNLGYPLLVGVSRKAFIGQIGGESRPDRRDWGSLAAGLHALAHGASILRVHDVKGTVQAVRVWDALIRP